MKQEILKYDKKLAEQWKGIFEIATPQETANNFNKVVEHNGEFYTPQKNNKGE